MLLDKKITIYDLARDLNVSPATVSRSLNDHRSISTRTKKMVIQRANELGYQVNKFAANLSKQQSNTLGVIVPKLHSSFMAQVISGMEDVASKSGYNLIISQSQESAHKESLSAKALYDSGVDGLMVSLAYDTSDTSHFSPFRQSAIPIIHFDRIPEEPLGSSVIIDNRKAAFDATRHLIESGSKQIMHITELSDQNVYRDRSLGFLDALWEAGFEASNKQIIKIPFHKESTKNTVDQILAKYPNVDGLFFANDNFAVQCMNLLQSQGIDIPGQIKIIGFNNDPICELVTPSLSTVEYPGFQIGRMAAQSLINHLKGDMDLGDANSISLKHRIVTRDSSR